MRVCANYKDGEVKPTEEYRRAMKRLNKQKNDHYQARAQAQRVGICKGHRGYPRGFMDARNLGFPLFE